PRADDRQYGGQQHAVDREPPVDQQAPLRARQPHGVPRGSGAPPPRGGRTERHGLRSPIASRKPNANRRAKSDGVPGGGDIAAETPPPGAPRSLSPAVEFVDRAQWAGLSDGAPPSPLEGEAKRSETGQP